MITGSIASKSVVGKGAKSTRRPPYLVAAIPLLVAFQTASCLPRPLSKVRALTATPPDLQAYNASIAPVSVYHPDQSSAYLYNHAPMITAFHGNYYIMWSAAPKDEDVDVDILYAMSDDGGKTWYGPGPGYDHFKSMIKFSPLMQNSTGKQIFSTAVDPVAGNEPDSPHNGASLQSGGFWTDGTTLVAYIQVFDTWYGGGSKLTKIRTSTDGMTWTDPAYLMDTQGKPVKGAMEESPKKFGNRLFTTFNIDNQDGKALVQSPFYTDDLTGQSGWTQASFTPADFKTGANQGKELEGSIFQAGTSLYTVYRNMQSSTLLLSKSSDTSGTAWSSADDFLAAGPNKQSANNLPSGEGFFLANPAGGPRSPMNMYITNDDGTLNRGFTLMTMDPSEKPRYPGLYKGPGFSYPNSFVDDKGVWIAYGRNKEDIEVILVDPNQLKVASATAP